MSDQWGVPQQQPAYPPSPPQYVDPSQSLPSAPSPQQYQQPPQQPVYAPQHGGAQPSPQQQSYGEPQQQSYGEPQQHGYGEPQPQYAQPGAIPQQGQYSQADAYAQQQQQQQQQHVQAAAPAQPPLPPPPIPHPNPVPQAEPYPAAQPGAANGGGPAENSGAEAGRAAESARSAGSGNSFATAGAATSFVPVVGLLLSLAGLIRSRGRGAGKAAARVGVVLSLLFTAAWGAAGYYVYKTSYVKATDPGCVSADADFLGYSAQLERDATAMADAAGSSGGAHSAAFTAAVRAYQADLAKLVADFDADTAKADASMKPSIEAVAGDLTSLDTDFGDLATGNFAAAVDLMDLNTKLMADFQQMESVCAKP